VHGHQQTLEDGKPVALIQQKPAAMNADGEALQQG